MQIVLKSQKTNHNNNVWKGSCWQRSFHTAFGTSFPTNRVGREGLEKQRSGLTVGLRNALDVVTKWSGCCGRCELVKNTSGVSRGRHVWDNCLSRKGIESKKKKRETNKQTMHTTACRTKERCYNKCQRQRWWWREQENFYPSTKRRNYLLKGTIFKTGGGVEYQAREQLISVLDTEVFNIADGMLN